MDLSDNYVKFIAASKGTSLEGEAARKIFEATASTMAVLGGETITTHRAFTALSQMMSKGQIYAEELKGQLAEAIPGALQLMSKALGITTNEMLGLMKAGQLSSDALLPFAIELEKKYGSLASSSKTFSQAINGIQTEWALLMKRLGDTGAWSLMTNAIDLLSKHSEVLAGVIGSGLGLAIAGLLKSISAWAASAKLSVLAMAKQTTAAGVLSKAIGWTTSANELAAKTALEKAAAEAESALASAEAAALAERQSINTVRQAELNTKAAESNVASIKAKIAVITEEDLAQQKLQLTSSKQSIAYEKLAQSLERERIAYQSSLTAKAEGIALATQELNAVNNSILRTDALVLNKEREVKSTQSNIAAIEAELNALRSGATQAELTATATANLSTQKGILAERTLLEEAALTKASLANARYNDVLKSRSFTNLITQEQELLKASIATTAATDAKRLKTAELLVVEQRQYASTLERMGIKQSEYALEIRQIEVEQQAINQKRIRGTATAEEIAREKQLGIAREELILIGNRLTIAEKNNEAAKARYMAQLRSQMALEQQLNVQVYSSLQTDELKAAAEWKRAYAAEQRALRLKLAAVASVQSAEQELSALTAIGAADEKIVLAETKLSTANSALTAQTKLLTAAQNEQSVLADRLTAATTRLAQAGAFELEVSRMNLAQKELAAKAALDAVTATELQIVQIKRKIAGLAEEGGSTSTLAAAESELLIIEERLQLAKAKSAVASNAVAKANLEAAAATQVVDNSQKKLAATQGILSRSWGMIALMVAGFAYMAFAFRDQDEATKALSKSTEEYTKSLEGMTAAQLIQTSNTAKELIDDKKQTISLMEREIELLKNGQGFWAATAVTWTAVGRSMQFWKTSAEQRIDAEAELVEQQKELTILEGKRAVGITKLLNEYDSLLVNNKELEKSNADLINSQEIQQGVVDELNSKWFKSTDEVIRLAVEQDKLRVISRELADSSRALSSSILLSDDALKTMSVTTGLNIEQLRAVFTGNEQYVNSLDAKAKAIARSIQRSLELNKLEAATALQIKLLKAEYDRVEGSIKAKTEASIKEATALGDMQAKREAEIAQGRALIKLAELSVASSGKLVIAKEAEIALKKEELIQDSKNADKINEKIGKLEVERQELIKTKAVRESNLVVVKAEAIATEVANRLISDSFTCRTVLLAQNSFVLRKKSRNGLLKRMRESMKRQLRWVRHSQISIRHWVWITMKL